MNAPSPETLERPPTIGGPPQFFHLEIEANLGVGLCGKKLRGLNPGEWGDVSGVDCVVCADLARGLGYPV